MKHYLSPERQLYAYNADGSQDHIIPANYIPVTDDALPALREQLEAERHDTLDYKEKRLYAYPSINDQLDMIFHEGLDAWKAKIQEVKDAIPKV